MCLWHFQINKAKLVRLKSEDRSLCFVFSAFLYRDVPLNAQVLWGPGSSQMHQMYQISTDNRIVTIFIFILEGRKNIMYCEA